MKTEEQIKQRINALKMNLEYNIKSVCPQPFETGKINYTIQALEWVLK